MSKDKEKDYEEEASRPAEPNAAKTYLRETAFGAGKGALIGAVVGGGALAAVTAVAGGMLLASNPVGWALAAVGIVSGAGSGIAVAGLGAAAAVGAKAGAVVGSMIGGAKGLLFNAPDELDRQKKEAEQEFDRREMREMQVAMQRMQLRQQQMAMARAHGGGVQMPSTPNMGQDKQRGLFS